MNAKLTLAARLIEYELRRIPFAPGRHCSCGQDLVLQSLVDADGLIDENRLSAKIAPDLPPYVLHRQKSTTDLYTQELVQQSLSEHQTDTLITLLQRRTCPKIVRMLHVMTRMLPIAIWILGMFVHSREAAPRSRLGERFGKTNKLRPKSRVIWLHAASLGEVKKLHNILSKLSHHSDITPVVTTYTASSAQWMASSFPNVIHQFAPLDTQYYVDHFLNHWRPECLVVVENELWPEMILGAARRGMRLVQLGARASSSRRKYRKVVGFLMTHFNLITCVNDEIRREFIDIGIAPERVLTDDETGAALQQLPVDEAQLANLRHQIGTRPVWVAASTHPTDMDIVLQAQSALCVAGNPILIMAPRHPRDARAIMRHCQTHGLSTSLRSMGDAITDNTDVYIADTFGELGTMFSLSQTVYLGGGIGNEGGHNPSEPAAFQCQILSGPRVANHEQAFAKLIVTRQAEFIDSPQQLITAVGARLSVDRPVQADVQRSTTVPVNPEPQMCHAAKLVLDHVLGTADNVVHPKENSSIGNLA